MSDLIETIQLGSSSRLQVFQDDGAQCPRGDWDMLTGFVKLGDYGDSRLSDVPAVHEPPFDIARLFYKLQNGRAFVGYTDIMYRRRIEDLDTVARLARMFYGLLLQWDDAHGGWWFVDLEKGRENFGLAADAQIPLDYQTVVIRQEQETYRQWADGEVYGVVLQRQQQYVGVIDSGSDFVADAVDWGNVIEIWEDVDDAALWGSYLDDEYTAAVVALEHFPLTADETAAANGMFPAGDLAAAEA